METINNTKHVLKQLKNDLRIKVHLKSYLKDRGIEEAAFANRTFGKGSWKGVLRIRTFEEKNDEEFLCDKIFF